MEGPSLCFRSNFVLQPPPCTTHCLSPMMLYPCYVNVSKRRQIVGDSRPYDFACTIGGGLLSCVCQSQKVCSGDFLPLLVRDLLLMHSPAVLPEMDALPGKLLMEDSGGGNRPSRAGRGNGGPVQAVQRVMSLLLYYSSPEGMEEFGVIHGSCLCACTFRVRIFRLCTATFRRVF